MAKPKPLTAAKRKKIPAAKMGLPALGKYPVDTPERAANAKARVAQMLAEGKIAPADAKAVIAKADKVLGGGKEKMAARKGPAEIMQAAKKRAGGKLPALKPVAKQPHPGMGKKKR